MTRLLALLAAILIAASPLPAPRSAHQSDVSVTVGPAAGARTGAPVTPVVPLASTPAGVAVRTDGAPSPKSGVVGRSLGIRGVASTYGKGWDGWIAWPGGPGVRLRVCGHGGCRVVTSNDSGPDKAMQRRGRIVDLDVRTFEAVCGIPWRRGLCWVTVTVVR